MNSHDDAGELRTSSWGFVAIWLGLATIFIGVHYDFFFFQLHTEIGDFGANALQIQKAKVFQELYGNYSRFGFHHPGPAFFYIYALGEWIFRDILHAVPSPFNAHIIAGIGLQTGLFVWALRILYRRSQNAVLVPLLLLLAAIHFGFVNSVLIYDSAFISIWPPHVLLFPFVCFVVASASFATGEYRDLFPAILCGCLLVHGHVAQPLFVLPIFVLALARFAWQSKSLGESVWSRVRAHRATTIASILVFAICLLPLLIDLLKGPRSNFHAILAYTHTYAGEHKTLAQSLLYLAHFTCYEPNPEKFCDRLDGGSYTSLALHWQFLAVWLLVLIAAVFFASRFKSRDKRGEFGFWLLVQTLLALFLTVLWGTQQAGPMLSFNSYFNYGLLFLVLTIAVLRVGLAQSLAVRRYVGMVLVALALPVWLGTAKGWHFRSDLPSIVANCTVMPELAGAVKSSEGRKKFLLYENGNWGWAVGVALELQRLSDDYAVPAGPGLEFDEEKKLTLEEAVNERLPIWHVLTTSDPLPGFLIRADGPRLVVPATIDPLHAVVVFSNPGRNASQYAISGWDFSEPGFAWSVEKTALFYFQPGKAYADVRMTIEAIPATFEDLPAQRMEVIFNGDERKTYSLSHTSTITFDIPVSLWNNPKPVVIRFNFPDAASPLAKGSSPDPRVLGCAFRQITFGPIVDR